MYQYTAFDQRIIDERARQFRGQVERRVAGSLTEDEFRPLRLQNGLYRQLHAYMLRVAIPYGLLSSKQLRMLAQIGRKYDRSYGHFSTRQNIQFNWPRLEDVPSILDDLASVQMHAVQTSGNCIRNVTSDPFAGVCQDELEDPRPYCEIIRQWSTFHPEFAFLPRKFKIAVTGATHDRAAIQVHDIGLRIVDGPAGDRGFQVLVGGGLGRSPFLAPTIREFLPKRHLLSYLEAILRVYNQHGRRDNIYKARIKILVGALGADAFRDQVEAEWAQICDGAMELTDAEITRVTQQFAPPAYERLSDDAPALDAQLLGKDRTFARWFGKNVTAHKQPGYASVVVALKATGVPPGDATSDQMDAVADIADAYGFGRIVVTHRQNLVLPDVRKQDLHALWQKLAALGFATPNFGHVTDMICCPGLDYCNLANARSIPLSQQIAERFDDLDYLYDLGPVTLNISGCINACGHHHVGNIGILGINKEGQEYYQIMLGGSHEDDAALGTILGRAVAYDEIPDAITRILSCYVEQRESEQERFLDAYRRVGSVPFQEAVYGAA